MIKRIIQKNNVKKMRKKSFFVSGEKYRKDITDYMNNTYGKKFNDELTLRYAFYGNIFNPEDRFQFDSKNLPDGFITVVFDPMGRTMTTNYMEDYYADQVTAIMKEIATSVLGECKVINEFGSEEYCDADFTYTLEDFMEKEGASFTIFIPADSKWIDEKMQDKAVELIMEECNKRNFLINTLDLTFLTEMYEEDFKYYSQFDEKHYGKRIVAYSGYACKDGIEPLYKEYN